MLTATETENVRLIVSTLMAHALLMNVDGNAAFLATVVDDIAKHAVAQADALLKELKKGD